MCARINIASEDDKRALNEGANGGNQRRLHIQPPSLRLFPSSELFHLRQETLHRGKRSSKVDPCLVHNWKKLQSHSIRAKENDNWNELRKLQSNSVGPSGGHMQRYPNRKITALREILLSDAGFKKLRVLRPRQKQVVEVKVHALHLKSYQLRTIWQWVVCRTAFQW